jgi:hypothetical protein
MTVPRVLVRVRAFCWEIRHRTSKTIDHDLDMPRSALHYVKTYARKLRR